MKHNRKNRHLIIVNSKEPPYPNAADHNYYAERALNVITALVSGMGFASAMLFLVTMA